jgi:hypothetical protein
MSGTNNQSDLDVLYELVSSANNNVSWTDEQFNALFPNEGANISTPQPLVPNNNAPVANPFGNQIDQPFNSNSGSASGTGSVNGMC